MAGVLFVGNTISVSVLDPSRVLVEGAGLRMAAVNQTSSFSIIETGVEFETEPTVQLRAPGGRELSVMMKLMGGQGVWPTRAGHGAGGDEKRYNVDYCTNEIGWMFNLLSECYYSIYKYMISNIFDTNGTSLDRWFF